MKETVQYMVSKCHHMVSYDIRMKYMQHVALTYKIYNIRTCLVSTQNVCVIKQLNFSDVVSSFI